MLMVECCFQTMLGPDGTLTRLAAESLRISQELLRRANETARQLSMQQGKHYLIFRFASQVQDVGFSSKKGKGNDDNDSNNFCNANSHRIVSSVLWHHRLMLVTCKQITFKVAPAPEYVKR